jgi:hypothetical protein
MPRFREPRYTPEVAARKVGVHVEKLRAGIRDGTVETSAICDSMGRPRVVYLTDEQLSAYRETVAGEREQRRAVEAEKAAAARREADNEKFAEASNAVDAILRRNGLKVVGKFVPLGEGDH